MASSRPSLFIRQTQRAAIASTLGQRACVLLRRRASSKSMDGAGHLTVGAVRDGRSDDPGQKKSSPRDPDSCYGPVANWRGRVKLDDGQKPHRIGPQCDTLEPRFVTTMLPDIDSLALFVRAAELRSLTKAAEASHIGLAAASRRMAMLEHRFKTTLLERSPRGVELTPAGKSLLAHAKALLVQLNQMQAEMSDHAAGRKGALRVMANTSAMTEFLPGDLASFAQGNPDVKLVIEERWSAEIVRLVLASEADIGIVVEGLQVEGLETFPYRTDRLAAVVPSNHALATMAPDGLTRSEMPHPRRTSS